MDIEKLSMTPEMREIATSMGWEKFKDFCHRWAGKLVRIPRYPYLVDRNKIIRKDAETMSVQGVANKHGLSKSQIFRIIRK